MMFTHPKKNVLILLVTIFVALVLLPSQPASANGTTFVVNSTGNATDNNIGDGICSTGSTINVGGNIVAECTFRAAVAEANFTAAVDTINFNIVSTSGGTLGQCTPSTTRTITLPNTTTNVSYFDAFIYQGTQYRAAYIVTKPVIIDGYTQCGASPNTQAVGNDGTIRVEFRGASASAQFVGLHFASGSSGSVVRGLALSNFGRGQLSAVHSNNHIFAGNYIGLRPDGLGANSLVRGGGNVGIRLFYAQNVIIGGTTPADRNIVSGVGNDGIQFEDGAAYNHIIGNYIGTAPNGVDRRHNASDQIDIQQGAHHNWVGGILLDGQGNPILDANGRTQADPNKRNIISGGQGDGLEITHETSTTGNHVVGNWIGLTATGTALGNGEDGINLEDHVNENHVYQNIIVNNGSDGVVIWAAEHNYIYDNWIGVLPDGTPMGNGTFKIGGTSRNPYSTSTLSKGNHGIHLLSGSDDNVIERNHIAYNGQYGIYLSAETTYSTDEDGGVVGNPEDESARCANQRNTISKNFMYGNEDFSAIRNRNGTSPCPLLQNAGMRIPVWVSASTNTLMGTLDVTRDVKDAQGNITVQPCSNCVVEVFHNSTITPLGIGDWVQGHFYIASGVTNSSGRAVVIFPQGGISADSILVATATDSFGNTSQFSNKIGTQPGQVDPPVCNSTPPANTLSVAKAGNNVQLNWNSTTGSEFYRVYRSADPTFTPSAATFLAQVNTGTTYADVNKLSDNDNAYYIVVGVNKCVQEAAASNRVGEVALPILPGQNLITLPIVPSQTSIGALFGAQLNGTGNPMTADQVRTYNNATKRYDTAWYCAGDCVAWGAPWANNWLNPDYTTSTMQLTPGMGFWVNNRGQETKYIKLVGNIATTINVNVYGKSNMLGASFPTSRTPAQLNLPATGGTSQGTSNTIRYWNAATQTEQSAWFCNCPANPTLHNQWVDPTTTLPTTMVIQPGTGFWYDNGTNGNFVWQSQ